MSNWTPLVEFHPAGGDAWLGIAGRSWVVGPSGTDDPTLVAAQPVALFALLEKPWSTIEAQLEEASELAGVAPPLAPLLTAALRTGSYWPELAVRWIEDGCFPPEIAGTLQEVADDKKRLSQQLRHRIRRLV